MFEKLKLLTEADPLLLYGFVYICPRGDFENLISKIHPFFPMAFVANELKQLSNVNTNEVSVLQIKNLHRSEALIPLNQ